MKPAAIIAKTGLSAYEGCGEWGINIDMKIPVFLIITLVILSFFAYKNVYLPGMELQRAMLAPGLARADNPPGGPIPPAGGNLAPAAAPGPGAERDRKIAAAISKYGERLAAREFMDDIKIDPCTAKVVAERQVSNILAALSAARDAGCIDRLRRKYIFRPSFIKLMAEVMSDPEVEPLLITYSGGAAAPGGSSVGASTGPKLEIPPRAKGPTER